MNIIIGFAGIIIAITGIVLGLKERFLANELRRTVLRLEKAQVAEIWTNLGIVATIFDRLDAAKEMLIKRKSVDYAVLCKVEGARRGTVDLYRHLLKEAALAEPQFTMKTIEQWRALGKLENEWRVLAAKRLLPTQNISNNKKNG